MGAGRPGFVARARLARAAGSCPRRCDELPGRRPRGRPVAQATAESRDRWGMMQLDHERLDVYDLALEFLVLANGIIEGLPRGRSHLADQFTRASLSIVLNLAEGEIGRASCRERV